MHLHLDPIGGIAGDMFAAALLDAAPEHAPALPALARAAGVPPEVTVALVAHRDHALGGRRFDVRLPAPHDPAHAHVPYGEVRARLERSALVPAVRHRALAIFALLAEAEAAVHGVPADAVTFHELGGWDSVVDIVTAAWLVETLGITRCTVGSLPSGRGTVQTAHGPLPVPSPAAAWLLRGYELHDDGRPGERVTPTGAAILRHLAASQAPAGALGRLEATGHGFGTMRLDGMSNVLRATLYAPVAAGPATEAVAVLEFEVDDQTPEDLAVALDRLRATDGVLDVVQASVLGKKGRLASAVRILARPEAVPALPPRVFGETTTLGVRWRIEWRQALARRTVHVPVDGGHARVKLAERPQGPSAKAESDDVAAAGDQAARAARRAAAESVALEGRTP